jgi:hypothetical protein
MAPGGEEYKGEGRVGGCQRRRKDGRGEKILKKLLEIC